MRHFLRAAAMTVLVAPAWVPAEAKAQEVDFSFFQEALAPYGDWVNLRGYGACWHPDVEEDWAPYTNGYWAYTDAGWTWVSHEPFGSIVFHYGRWLLTTGGWCWVPGGEWGPAWVSWRRGAEHVGWAPLPPSVPWNPQRGISAWVDVHTEIGPGYYRFCGVRDFCSPNLNEVIIRPSHNVSIMLGTENVTNIRSLNNSVYCGGPEYRWVRQNVPVEVPLLRVVREENVQRYYSMNVSGNYGTVRNFVYQGMLVLPGPLRVEVALSQRNRPMRSVEVSASRGWYEDDAGSARLRSHMNREWELREAAQRRNPEAFASKNVEVKIKPVSAAEHRGVFSEVASRGGVAAPSAQSPQHPSYPRAVDVSPAGAGGTMPARVGGFPDRQVGANPGTGNGPTAPSAPPSGFGPSSSPTQGRIGSGHGESLFSGGQSPTGVGAQPVNGVQPSLNGGQMPVNGGQMPVNGGQMPVNGGQMPEGRVRGDAGRSQVSRFQGGVEAQEISGARRTDGNAASGAFQSVEGSRSFTGNAGGGAAANSTGVGSFPQGQQRRFETGSPQTLPRGDAREGVIGAPGGSGGFVSPGNRNSTLQIQSSSQGGAPPASTFQRAQVPSMPPAAAVAPQSPVAAPARVGVGFQQAVPQQAPASSARSSVVPVPGNVQAPVSQRGSFGGPLEAGGGNAGVPRGAAPAANPVPAGSGVSFSTVPAAGTPAAPATKKKPGDPGYVPPQ